jgi:hypothetical protein
MEVRVTLPNKILYLRAEVILVYQRSPAVMVAHSDFLFGKSGGTLLL